MKFKILNSFQQKFFVVFECAKPSVAMRAQQPSNTFPATLSFSTARMIMINGKTLIRGRIAADSAAILLLFHKLIIVFNRQLVVGPQSVTQVVAALARDVFTSRPSLFPFSLIFLVGRIVSTAIFHIQPPILSTFFRSLGRFTTLFAFVSKSRAILLLAGIELGDRFRFFTDMTTSVGYNSVSHCGNLLDRFAFWLGSFGAETSFEPSCILA
jgi:hypothetical protein